MNTLTVAPVRRKGLRRIAQAGLTSKGFVYLILGAVAFMAAFELGGQSASKADKSHVLNLLKDNYGGEWLLPLLALGLTCYSVWRMVQVYRSTLPGNQNRWLGVSYFISGAVYFMVAVSAFKVWMNISAQKEGDKNQQLASELLSQPMGQWLLGITALIFAGVGIFQVYYGISGRYREHVQKMNLHDKASSALLLSGKIGYIARGVVWLIISYLTIRAALHARSAEAGDTGKAFNLIENSPNGSLLLGAVGIGLIAYGIFSLVRARYEEFN